MELEHLVMPLGHSGSVHLARLKEKHQFQNEYLESLVKSELDNRELRDAAFGDLLQLKNWFDDNLMGLVMNPSK